jgi:hypothetical protein
MAASPQTQVANARPWRKWATDNGIGINSAQRAISSGKLKVRMLGKKMLVLHADGLRFLESLPEGPGRKPNFEKDAT